MVVMELKTYLSLMEGVGAGVKDVHSVRAKRVWIRSFACYEGHPMQICAAHGGKQWAGQPARQSDERSVTEALIEDVLPSKSVVAKRHEG